MFKPMDWYEPDEDSYTLLDVLEEEAITGRVVVDLGTSTGILTESLCRRNTVVSLDLNIRALRNHSGGNLVRADLLMPLNQAAVDVVVFNPPYVADTDSPIIGGGPRGRCVIDRFIAALSVQTVYLLVIEVNRPREVAALLEERGYDVQLLRRRKILGETIYILRGSRNQSI